MSQDDPFESFGSDRTVILPTPGARVAPPRATYISEPEDTSEVKTVPTGLNRLIAEANPLLGLVPQLRGTIQHPNPEQLRQELSRAIRDFEARARAAGIQPEHVIAARYILCTLLDETVASTPWGPHVWARQSLLVEFHNQSWGGEKVFQLASKFAGNPAAYRDLLELIFICLQLGFEGRYRVIENGRAQLDALQERLYQLLRKQQAENERSLSPHWQGTAKVRRRWFGAIPLWVIGSVCALALVSIYLSFNFSLSRTSDRLASEIAQIRVAPPAPARPRPVVTVEPRLARFLASEIAQGYVEVSDRADRSVVTIRGDGLFEPGSDVISPHFEWLVARIAQALASVAGQVEITGHTDNIPIRTLRFPSNYELSTARAESVQKLIAHYVPHNRLRASGRADLEPLAVNDSPQNRARNRRVTVTLYTGGQVEAAQ